MVAYHLEIPCIHVYGDSRIIIDGISGKSNLQGQHLKGWIDRTQYILSKFQDFMMNHIYREHNMHADILSKTGLEAPFGSISVLHFIYSI